MIKAVIFDMYETLITQHKSPVYFGAQIAKDLNIDAGLFLRAWNSTSSRRTTGALTLRQAVELIMREHNCYSKSLLDKIEAKRISAKEECFNHINPEVIELLTEIKKRKLKTGLISNCFSEEAAVIRRNTLLDFFDAVFLSYEQGVEKPDKEIFYRCLSFLDVRAQECIYIGDGGSDELVTAESIGMTPLRAAWYLNKNDLTAAEINQDFLQLNSPLEALNYII